MFRKAEMVRLPDGGIRFVNIELEPSIIKDILSRCENEGWKIHAMREALDDTMRELSNLTSFYDDPDLIINELEININKQFAEKFERNKRESQRRKRKRSIMDSIDEKIENVLDNIDDDADINLNIDTSISEYKPEPVAVKEPLEKELEEPEKIDFVFEVVEDEVRKNE